MKKTAINKGRTKSYNSTLRYINPKTANRNAVWRDRCLWRINHLINKYGFLICEYCGRKGSIDSQSFTGMWGHHIDGNRNNTDISNCYICHTATCHRDITDNNLMVIQEDFQGKNAMR